MPLDRRPVLLRKARVAFGSRGLNRRGRTCRTSVTRTEALAQVSDPHVHSLSDDFGGRRRGDWPLRRSVLVGRFISALATPGVPGVARKSEAWCPGKDSNLHASRHTDLNRARLPIPPPGQVSRPDLGRRFRGVNAPAGSATCRLPSARPMVQKHCERRSSGRGARREEHGGTGGYRRARPCRDGREPGQERRAERLQRRRLQPPSRPHRCARQGARQGGPVLPREGAQGLRRVDQAATPDHHHGEGRRTRRRGDRGAAALSRQGRHRHRRRQFRIHRHQPPRSDAEGEGLPLRRHGRVGRRGGRAARAQHDARRRARGLFAHRAHREEDGRCRSRTRPASPISARKAPATM